MQQLFPVLDHSLQIPVTWPRGNYGLMKTAAGCPGAKVSWQSGWRHYDTEDLGSNNGYSSGISHFLAGSFASDDIRTDFCIKTISSTTTYDGLWPRGSYCLLKYRNCPNGFRDGSDGQSSAAMILPTDRPFVLMRYGGKCQTVYGMSVRDLYVHWDDDDLFNKDSASGMHPDDTGDGDNHELHFCYYQSSGHGGIIG
ncbi:hypothetical protein MAR_007987 [Mya arenaria]|uniref:Apextrin C-terminal domain-containing protein n=1 Tax=Mya arenaria TaxID=6604 RepID=A0ABY7DZ48_MYAAR|nr:hypothetical protein MAR_007987 [Mya arenaria]